MVEKLFPELNKVYFINKYTLIHILSGHGSIQVDFKNYFNWQDKAIYLSKGQYIKFLSDDFVIRKIEFPNEAIFKSKEVRVLFKHLLSLGYINFSECADCQKYLSHTVFSDKTGDILDISSKQWYWQNPFHASKEEYQIIFDVKDVIDNEFTNHLSARDITKAISTNGNYAQTLLKDKIGLSIKSLIQNKLLTESQKNIAFTDKNIQEIAYDLGFKDPAYFNRLFKNKTGQSPKAFRDNFDYKHRDRFTQNILELIKTYHATEHSLEFYANKMNISVKTLSKKVRQKMNASLGQLIRFEIIYSAKQLLDQGLNVKETSLQLGFEEPNHFSAFFKHYTGFSPSKLLY